MAAVKDGCVKPSQGPILSTITAPTDQPQATKEAPRVIAKVGKPAPDFELSAFIDGGFKNLKLSDFKGKWIVICFYPGDFTFV